MNWQDFFPITEMPVFSITWPIKLLFFVLVIGMILYTILLVFRIKILSETVFTTFNKYVTLMTLVVVIAVIVLGLISLALISLA